MKIFMITDTHFGVFPLRGSEFKDMMSDYFYNFFIPLLEKRVEPGDILIHLGDLFDNRNYISIDILNLAEEIMVKISEILPVHLIVGNHDIYNKSNNNINSPKSFRWIPNFNVYEETTKLEFGGKELILMPWVEKRKEQIELLQMYSGSDYLFCHSDLNGCRMHLNSVAHRNLNKIDVDEFGGYGKVFSGHIHIRQENKNFTFIGSPYQLDRNDYNDRKGVYILDIESDDLEFIENDYSPEFKRVIIQTEGDMDSLVESDLGNNYVDVEISNTLLIENRKARRKLDKLLEVKKFTKVDYINDVIKEEKPIDIEEVDMGDIDIKDLEKVVKTFIENKGWSSDDIRDGILKEYKKISDIYQSEFKNNK